MWIISAIDPLLEGLDADALDRVDKGLGTLAALALERFTFRGKKVFDGLLYLPIIIPDVTMAVMMLLFFSEFFEIINSIFGPETSPRNPDWDLDSFVLPL